MRAIQTIILASALIFAVPTVVADPTYEVPEVGPVVAAAEQFNETVISERDAFLGAVGDAKEGVFAGLQEDDPRLSNESIVSAATAAGDFGAGVAGAAGTLKSDLGAYAAERRDNKIAEASATIDAGIGVAVAAINAGGTIAGAFASVVCNDGLTQSLTEGSCDSESLFSTAGTTVQSVGESLTQEASNSPDRTDRVREAMENFLAHFADFPELGDDQ